MKPGIGIKAAFCFYGPNSLGGPATWVRRILPRLARRGMDVVAVPYHTAEGECPVAADLLAAGIPVRAVKGAALTPAKGVQRTLEALADERPQVTVADHVLPALIAAGWARQYGVPSVMVLRSDDAWYQHLRDNFLTGLERRRVASVVAVSRELEDAARVAAPLGVEIMRCPSGTPIPATRAQWRDDAFHVLYLGRLDENQKRVRELVQELIATARVLPTFSATLYGDGPLREELENTLRGEASGQVAYGGRLSPSNVFPRMLEAQALVLFSAYEGLSSAVQEAMACGLPVIARRTSSGVEGVLMHGETAWILKTDQELKEAASCLARSASEWQRLADGARDLAMRQFDIEAAADRWAELLARVGNGVSWPAGVAPAVSDGEVLYHDYLIDKIELEVFEAAALIDEASVWGAGLDHFFRNSAMPWDDRRCLLHRAASKGLLDSAAAAGYARLVAEDAEIAAGSGEAQLYRVASLWQLAGDNARAASGFASVAKLTTLAKLRAGCYFHLAELALAEGRPIEATRLARACLAIEPAHSAAAQVLKLTNPVK